MTIRILLADDHSIVRAGLRTLIATEPDLEVVGEAVEGSQAVTLAGSLHPDLILMDISLQGMSGIDALEAIKGKYPDIKVLMLTFHEDESLLRKALRAGACGYIIKRAAEAELLNAIRVVLQGDIYIHPSMTRMLLKDITPARNSSREGENTLTNREVEILRMIAHGYTNNQIARQLSISVRTVEGHRANLMDKLNLHSRVDLVEYAEQHGILD